DACAVPRPAADLHRRRHHRRERVRHPARARRHRLLGRPRDRRCRRPFRRARRRARLARRACARGPKPRLMTDHGLDPAGVGNGRTAALVDPQARIVWWCFPRYDGDPLFCRLLAGDEEKGFTDVVLDDMVDCQSEYVRNTAVVTTVLTDRHGAKVRITDFAPRFHQFGRVFRPPQLFRIIEPVAGLPRITIRVRPTHGYGRPLARHSSGSNHIRYHNETTVLRLTTDAPLSLIESAAPVVVTRPLH